MQGAYQYTDKQYLGQNQHPVGKCQDCHDVHELEVKTDGCKACHGDTKPEDIRMVATDWDGDGDTTEGVMGEIDTLAEALFAEIQKYAKDTAGAGIVYDAAAYPYFMLDADGDGQPDKNDQGANIAYNAWTPRLLKAAYNYQYVQKDPGAFVHNPQYVMQFLIDSIARSGRQRVGLHPARGSCSAVVADRQDAKQRPGMMKCPVFVFQNIRHA